MEELRLKIEFQEVTKQYKRNTFAVKNVSMEIPDGVFGLIGRNGAGKTTILNMLATILTPTSGKILFDGKDIEQYGDELRGNLGFLPQDTKLQPTLTAYEFLDYIAILKNIRDKQTRKDEIERCLEVVGLQNEYKKNLGAFSGGMLRRAGIAQALLGSPKLMILDEPTTGLDPEERLYFRNLISKFGTERTVILSTHIISDIQNICNDACILDNGSVVYSGNIEGLIGKVKDKVWECTAPTTNIEEIKRITTVTAVAYMENEAKIRYISKESVYPTSEKQEATLEDAYIYSVGGVQR
jgi:ABC-2 type transport system ATP-binding protein